MNWERSWPPHYGDPLSEYYATTVGWRQTFLAPVRPDFSYPIPPLSLYYGLDVASYLAYRYWHGPVIGLAVTQVWQGFAARVFLSFGRLAPSNYTLPSGAQGRPHGEFELTNMDSFSDWALTLKCRFVATGESRRNARESGLQRLLGRRLLSVQIDERTRSTVLRFTREFVLTTKTMPNCQERRPHWLLRLSKENWPPVIINGTSSRWRGKSGYD